MEAPSRIHANSSGNWYLTTGTLRRKKSRVQYIRADLVEKLIDKHAIHSGGCPAHKYGTCTCGLTDIIAQIRGEP